MGVKEFEPAALKPGVATLTVAKRDRVSQFFDVDPQRIATAMRGALDNDWDAFGDMCAIFDAYRLRCPGIRKVTDKLRRKLSKWPWSIKPPTGASDATKNRCKEVEAAIASIPRFRRKILWELSDAPIKGFAAVELFGEKRSGRTAVAGGRGVPQWALKKVKVARKETWFFKAETAAIHSDVSTGGPAVAKPDEAFPPGIWKAVPPGKLLVWDIEDQGSLLSSGLMWPLIWLGLFATFGLKDWIAFMEVYGMPTRVGKLPAGYDINSPEADILARAVIDAAADSGVIITSDMEIEFVTAMQSGSSDAFLAFQDWADTQMLEMVLGAAMPSKAGKEGARSLGEVQQDEVQETIDFLVEDQAEAIDEGLVGPLWGDNVPRAERGTFRFNTETTRSRSKRWVIDQGLIASNVPIGVKYFYDKYDVPEPEPGEPVVSLDTGAQPNNTQPNQFAAQGAAVRKAGDPAEPGDEPPVDQGTSPGKKIGPRRS